MTLTIVLAGWAVLSLVATAGTALMCWGGKQEDIARAERPLTLPVPRTAADDQLPTARDSAASASVPI